MPVHYDMQGRATAFTGEEWKLRNGLAIASKFTGKPYTTRQVDLAIRDLTQWIDTHPPKREFPRAD